MVGFIFDLKQTVNVGGLRIARIYDGAHDGFPIDTTRVADGAGGYALPLYGLWRGMHTAELARIRLAS